MSTWTDALEIIQIIQFNFSQWIGQTCNFFLRKGKVHFIPSNYHKNPIFNIQLQKQIMEVIRLSTPGISLSLKVVLKVPFQFSKFKIFKLKLKIHTQFILNQKNMKAVPFFSKNITYLLELYFSIIRIQFFFIYLVFVCLQLCLLLINETQIDQ